MLANISRILRDTYKLFLSLKNSPKKCLINDTTKGLIINTTITFDFIRFHCKIVISAFCIVKQKNWNVNNVFSIDFVFVLITFKTLNQNFSKKKNFGKPFWNVSKIWNLIPFSSSQVQLHQPICTKHKYAKKQFRKRNWAQLYQFSYIE